MQGVRIFLNRGVPARLFTKTFIRSCSDGGAPSITYSGGQASEGQGGFYGSGGARAVAGAVHHPGAKAHTEDIQQLAKIMSDVNSLDQELISMGNIVNSRTIEIKSKIKKTISNPQVRELLKRLEIKGGPVWGLSVKERELVKSARQKYMGS